MNIKERVLPLRQTTVPWLVYFLLVSVLCSLLYDVQESLIYDRLAWVKNTVFPPIKQQLHILGAYAMAFYAAVCYEPTARKRPVNITEIVRSELMRATDRLCPSGVTLAASFATCRDTPAGVRRL